MSENPDRNLAMELVRVTEAAALAAARWVGRGDKRAADKAAVDAMRHMLGRIEMDGKIVIGEGEKDDAPMLFIYHDLDYRMVQPYVRGYTSNAMDRRVLKYAWFDLSKKPA